MDYKALRYFHEVAKLSSFTRAAESLSIAQPAVSMAIKRLEEQLRLTLFHRKDRKIALTDEGEKLYQQSTRIIQAMNDADLEMDELRGLEKGVVHLGVPGMLGSYFFPPLVMAFKHRYPKLRLSVLESGAWQLQQMLENGDIDLAVIESGGIPDNVDATPILRDEMQVVVSTDHPLAKVNSVTPKELFEHELVVFRQGYFHRRLLDQMAEEAGIEPSISFETNLLPLIRSIIKQGFGISTLLKMAVENDPALVTLPFEPPVCLDLCLAWRKDSYLSKANRAFVGFMLEQTALTPKG